MANDATETTVYNSHPIRQSSAKGPWKISLILSQTLTSLLLYALLTLPLFSPSSQAIHRQSSPNKGSISLILEESGPKQEIQPPTIKRIGPPGPGGLGHREGTGTIDPRPLTIKTSAISFSTEAIDPDMLSHSSRAEAVLLSINPALPIQSGGNGLSKGTGKDPALGNGGLWHLQESITSSKRDQQTPVPDGRLVPIRRQEAKYFYTLGDLSEEIQQVPVIVRIVVAENGRVTWATVISGPEEGHASALWAAKLWLFEPLGRHGIQAPLTVDLVFKPRHRGF